MKPKLSHQVAASGQPEFYSGNRSGPLTNGTRAWWLGKRNSEHSAEQSSRRLDGTIRGRGNYARRAYQNIKRPYLTLVVCTMQAYHDPEDFCYGSGPDLPLSGCQRRHSSLTFFRLRPQDCRKVRHVRGREAATGNKSGSWPRRCFFSSDCAWSLVVIYSQSENSVVCRGQLWPISVDSRGLLSFVVLWTGAGLVLWPRLSRRNRGDSFTRWP